MLNCTYYGCNERLLFATVVAEKKLGNRLVLDPLIDDVIECYDQYLDNFQEIGNLPETRFPLEEQQIALQGCYGSRTQSFKFVFGKIFTIQPNTLRSFCPYCLVDRPKTLDHYISKTGFPEFSILVKNLVPCCYTCNQKKDELWRGADNSRQFIHFYNDLFLHHTFLQAQLLLPPHTALPSLQYILQRPPAMDEVHFNIVSAHFNNLNLLEMYQERSRSTFSTELEVIRRARARDVTIAEIQQGITDRQHALEAEFGVNYYLSRMYHEMANNLGQLLAP